MINKIKCILKFEAKVGSRYIDDFEIKLMTDYGVKFWVNSGFQNKFKSLAKPTSKFKKIYYDTIAKIRGLLCI